MPELLRPIDPASRPLCETGLRVSPIAGSIWRYCCDDLAAATARVEAVLAAGINVLDTADVYDLDDSEPFGAAEAMLARLLTAARAAPHS